MKKILSLTLAVLMVASMIPTVFAAETTDYTNGTAVEYVADNDANREYTITVPASLAPGASGTVTLSGTWASNETVKVTADASVTLTNSINEADTKTLDVTFAGIEKAGDNTAAQTYTETVSVAAMPADALFGTWSGKFNYNVEFDDGVVVNPYSTSLDGTNTLFLQNSVDENGIITFGALDEVTVHSSSCAVTYNGQDVPATEVGNGLYTFASLGAGDYVIDYVITFGDDNTTTKWNDSSDGWGCVTLTLTIS